MYSLMCKGSVDDATGVSLQTNPGHFTCDGKNYMDFWEKLSKNSKEISHFETSNGTPVGVF